MMQTRQLCCMPNFNECGTRERIHTESKQTQAMNAVLMSMSAEQTPK